MYRRALLTVLSTENARAKIGSGCVLLRPASSIHLAEPQSDCCRSPVSKVAGALQAEASPAASHTLTCQAAGCRDASGCPPQTTSD